MAGSYEVGCQYEVVCVCVCVCVWLCTIVRVCLFLFFLLSLSLSPGNCSQRPQTHRKYPPAQQYRFLIRRQDNRWRDEKGREKQRDVVNKYMNELDRGLIEWIYEHWEIKKGGSKDIPHRPWRVQWPCLTHRVDGYWKGTWQNPIFCKCIFFVLVYKVGLETNATALNAILGTGRCKIICWPF